ncbi:hypothetical protein AVEN_217116-1 [Araneus ventricosus]|uniref:Mos1 transposase HTH domain-containing protein n=1 Tax=Araneus ventricosus TaxID=182803 RepID=A0A4Y2E9U4_ARAVE|nr:hypothetical protein AVEN_217116-1 [Araneus ventricosus]
MFTSPRHDHTDEQHRPCVAWQFKSEQKRAVNNAQKGYIVEEGDFPERPVTRSGTESTLITMKVEVIKNEKGSMLHKFIRRMKEVYGEQCLARCTIFRWCQRYEAGCVNTKDLPRPGQAHVVTNSAKISAVDELMRLIVGSPHVKLLLNCR